MLTQQQRPIISGFPPVLMSFTISVFSPIAAIARTIKNLDSSLIGVKKSAEIPADTAMVVIMEAPMKYRIKNGKISLMLTLFPSAACPFFVRINASTAAMPGRR